MAGQYTSVKFDREAIDAIYEGVNEVCEATATTLGPLGRNVLIDKGYETTIIHDGVSVANSINPEEPFKRNGAKVIQEAAKKQRDEVGDGTTAVMILTQAILKESLKVTAAGVNPMTLRQGLESGAKKVVKKLQKLSKPVRTLEQKTQIATVSAEDEDLGRLVAETIEKTGADGVITVENSKSVETYVEHQEGMQVDKGYYHAFMVTDPERMQAVIDDIHILVTDRDISTIAEIGRFLDMTIFPNTKKVLFISPNIGVDFLQVLLGAKASGRFLGLAMKAPGVGSMQTDILQDICALTGATLISKDAGMKFDDMTFDVLGQATRVVMSKLSTIISGGKGHKEDIMQRIAVIRKQQEDVDLTDYDREQLKARLAKLTNGVAVIKVGGSTDVEVKERYERALDAVCATQSAVKHGLVSGGEIAYLACLDVLNEKILGEKILKDALSAPFERLVENAGYDSGRKLSEMAYTQLDVEEARVGLDVSDGKYKDMIKAGIVDPASVPMTAVDTAVSVAVQLSSLGAAVVLQNEEKK